MNWSSHAIKTTQRVDWIGEIQSNSLRLFKIILGEDLKINRPRRSPLRQDKNPSFCIYLNKNLGILMYKDYATGEGGDVIKLYSQLKGISYKDAVKGLRKEINVDWSNEVYKYSPKRNGAKIGVKRKRWIKTDIEYWKQYGISVETLELYKVAPISEYIVGDKCRFKYSVKCPMYVYKIFNSLKIYRPLSENRIDKWRTTCSAYDIQGWEQARKTKQLIVTKSLKDVMALHEMGYVAIAPSSENTQIPDEVIDATNKLSDCIIILFDNDNAGIKSAEKLQRKCPTWNIIYTEEAKDLSDAIKLSGKDKVKEWIKEKIKDIWKSRSLEQSNAQQTE